MWRAGLAKGCHILRRSFPDDALFALIRDAIEFEDPMDLDENGRIGESYSNEMELLAKQLIRAKPTSVNDVEQILIEVFSVSFDADAVASRAARWHRVACVVHPQWLRLADEY